MYINSFRLNQETLKLLKCSFSWTKSKITALQNTSFQIRKLVCYCFCSRTLCFQRDSSVRWDCWENSIFINFVPTVHQLYELYELYEFYWNLYYFIILSETITFSKLNVFCFVFSLFDKFEKKNQCFYFIFVDKFWVSNHCDRLFYSSIWFIEFLLL